MIDFGGESRVEYRLVAQSRIHGWKYRETVEDLKIVFLPRSRNHRFDPVEGHPDEIIF
jgi:hypothetical protein